MAKTELEMQIKQTKKLKTGGSFRRETLVLGLAVLLAGTGSIGIFAYAKGLKTKVDVLAVSKSVNPDTNLTGLFTKVSMTESDVTPDMLLFKDADKYKDQFTKTYIRKDTPIYKDSIGIQTPSRTKYLYDMQSDQEAITFPYASELAGGKILMPGDLVRIRIQYIEKTPDGKDNIKQDTFDSVEIKDILNNNLESIFDLTNDMMRLTAEERYQVVSSQKFRDQLTPKALVFLGNKDIADRAAKYVQFANNSNKTFITILKRNPDIMKDSTIASNSLLELIDPKAQNAASISSAVSGATNNNPKPQASTAPSTQTNTAPTGK
jgi:hypothetical protein